MPSPQGIFCGLSDIQNVFGINNTIQYSNLDNSSTTLDPARTQTGINYSDSKILWIFGRSNVNIQALAGDPTITDYGAKIAGVWMYQSRGYLDKDAIGNQYAEMLRNVMKELQDIASGKIVLPNTPFRWPAPSAPVSGTWGGN